MNIFIKLKSVGKRRPVLDNTPYTLNLPEGAASLRRLIEAIVRQEVEKYNARGTENMLVPFLTEKDIEDQSSIGKVGFGRIYSDKKADPEKAVETALQGFEDGLFRVVVGDGEAAGDGESAGVREAAGLDEPLIIHENDVLTFIRLTFLSGRLW